MTNASLQHPGAGLPGERPALVVAHPGHELRVFHWLEVARPVVFVLTDGSGGRRESRLESTRRLLDQTRATAGGVFGPFADRQVYSAILEGRSQEFISLLDRFVDEWIRREIDYVVGDACEGSNPSHDVCRLLIGAAGEALARRGRRLPNFDFPLAELPDAPRAAGASGAVMLRLDDAAFERKFQAARGYEELAREVAAATGGRHLDAFRTECLRPVGNREGFDGPPEDPPLYERFGRLQVSRGIYKQVLCYRDHVRPLSDALWAHATRSTT